MGAACNCTREVAVRQIQPDTQIMKIRVSPAKTDEPKASSTQSTIYDIDSDIISSQDEGNFEDNLFEEFLQAIKDGNDTMITFYLEEYPSMNLFNIKDKNNDTVLQTAIKYKRYYVMEQILKEASINERNTETGDTSMHLAARLHDIIAIKILLNYKPDLTIMNYDDETALTIAHEHHFNDITDILMSILEPQQDENKTDTQFVALKPANDGQPKIQLSAQIDRMSTVGLIDITNDVLADSQHMHSPNNIEQLSRLSTNRLNVIADDIFNDIVLTVRHNKQHAITLHAWL
eukprot:283723_1